MMGRSSTNSFSMRAGKAGFWGRSAGLQGLRFEGREVSRVWGGEVSRVQGLCACHRAMGMWM